MASSNLQEVAASSSTTNVEETFSKADTVQGHGLYVCEWCGIPYGSRRGLSQHKRHAHATEYHLECVPTFTKERWSHEETVLVAREEIRLSRAGVSSVNFNIFRKFRNRMADAIKCLRRSASYKAICDRLVAESDGALAGRLPSGHEHGVGMEAVCEDEVSASGPHPASELGETMSSPVLGCEQKGWSGWSTPIPKSRRGPKVRWTDDELMSMAREEMRLVAEGCRKLNIKLSEFPSTNFRRG